MRPPVLLRTATSSVFPGSTLRSLRLRAPQGSPPPLRAPAPATPAAAATSRRVHANAQAPAAPTGGGHANSGASASGRAQARGRRWAARVADVVIDAIFVVGTLPFLFYLFAFACWLGDYMWCLGVVYLLLAMHPEWRG